MTTETLRTIDWALECKEREIFHRPHVPGSLLAQAVALIKVRDARAELQRQIPTEE